MVKYTNGHNDSQWPHKTFIKNSQIMYKYILESVENINWLAVASLLVFFVIFVVSTMWAFLSKKEHIDKMANLPLEEE